MDKEKVDKKESNGFVPAYFTLVGFWALACLLAMAVYMMTKVNANLEQKSADLRTQERRYDYVVLQKNALNVRETAERLQYQKYTKEEASRALLVYADYLFSRYGASVNTDIMEEPGRLVIGLKLARMPVDVYDFIATLYDLLSLREPATFIDSVKWSFTHPPKPNDILPYTVEYTLRAVHPYYEGAQ